MTNPAIDPFREAVVTSLRCFIGPEGDITASSPAHAHRLELAQPVLRPQEMAALKAMAVGGWKTQVGGCVCVWGGGRAVTGAVATLRPPTLEVLACIWPDAGACLPEPTANVVWSGGLKLWHRCSQPGRLYKQPANDTNPPAHLRLWLAE